MFYECFFADGFLEEDALDCVEVLRGDAIDWIHLKEFREKKESVLLEIRAD